jgi:hypothetical protein
MPVRLLNPPKVAECRVPPNQDPEFSSERPYRCNFCPEKKNFTTGTDLVVHCMAEHTDDKAFGCGVCGREFSRASSCRAHEQRDHGLSISRAEGEDMNHTLRSVRLMPMNLSDIVGIAPLLPPDAAPADTLLNVDNYSTQEPPISTYQSDIGDIAPLLPPDAAQADNLLNVDNYSTQEPPISTYQSESGDIIPLFPPDAAPADNPLYMDSHSTQGPPIPTYQSDIGDIAPLLPPNAPPADGLNKDSRSPTVTGHPLDAVPANNSSSNSNMGGHIPTVSELYDNICQLERAIDRAIETAQKLAAESRQVKAILREICQKYTDASPSD